MLKRVSFQICPEGGDRGAVSSLEGERVSKSRDQILQQYFR